MVQFDGCRVHLPWSSSSLGLLIHFQLFSMETIKFNSEWNCHKQLLCYTERTCILVFRCLSILLFLLLLFPVRSLHLYCVSHRLSLNEFTSGKTRASNRKISKYLSSAREKKSTVRNEFDNESFVSFLFAYTHVIAHIQQLILTPRYIHIPH